MGCGSSKPAPEPLTDTQALRGLGYEAEEILGEGAFGEVLLVEEKVDQGWGLEYACKKLKKERVNEAWLDTEVGILKACRHPNIVFLREVLVATEHNQVFLVLELARGGSLLDKIEEEKGLSQQYAASVLIQLSSALDYLHSREIVHRDMKPENVLLLDRSARSLVKLCDFGLSKMQGGVEVASAPAAAPVAKKTKALMETRVGSHYYASPELLLEQPYDASIDMWGLGHILFTSLTAIHPFDDSMDQFGDVTTANVEYSHKCWAEAPEAQRLCEALLCATPSKRLTPRAVLSHSWLAAIEHDRRINLSLRYLGRVGSMRGVCLRCLETVLPEDYRAELRREFDALDSDAKGYLNGQDVRRALKRQKEGDPSSRRERSSWAASSEEETTPRHSDAVAPEASVQSAAGGSPVLRPSMDQKAAWQRQAAATTIDVRGLLQALLQSALESSGVGKKKKAHRQSGRAAQGARRVGVVSFSMFAEAALERNPALVRKLWDAAFAALDADADGTVGDADLAAFLHGLGIELDEEGRSGLLHDAKECNSKELLRLVLRKGA